MSSWDAVGTTAWLSDNLRLLLIIFVDLVVVVGFPGYDGLLGKIERGRRRLHSPLQTSGAPRVIGRGFAVTHRPQEIDHRQEIAHGKNRRARGREHIEHLILGRILPVAARHAQIAEDELREEGKIESEKYDQRSQTGQSFGIEPARNFGPPEMHAT